MEKKYALKTPRLGLREWTEKDTPPFIQMNLDLDVMRYYPRILTPKHTMDLIAKIEAHFKKYGYGLWAVDELVSGRFMGYIGLAEFNFDTDFSPGMEIGWRLSNEFWNKGYATEGAITVLKYAFSALELKLIYSFTTKTNKPSIRVMEKIGLKPAGEFNHPNMDLLNPLSRHVLYRLSSEEYFQQAQN